MCPWLSVYLSINLSVCLSVCELKSYMPHVKKEKWRIKPWAHLAQGDKGDISIKGYISRWLY